MINLDERDNVLLQEIKEVVVENNKILHSMRRTARISMFMNVVYWIVIIAISVGAFIYVQPYIDQVMKTYSSFKQTEQKVSAFPQNFSLNSLKDYFGMSTSTQK